MSSWNWLVMLARSRAIDRLRADKQATHREEPLEYRATVVSAQAALQTHSDMRGLVGKALSALPPEQREAIELAYFGGLTHSEIAAHLKQPLGTVKTRLRLAMIKLRELLQNRYGKSRRSPLILKNVPPAYTLTWSTV